MARQRMVLTIAALLVASCGSPRPPARPPAVDSAGKDPGPAAPPALQPGDALSAHETCLLLAVWRDEDSGGTLHLVNAETGEEIAGRGPLPLGENYWHSLSPDGRTLAVLTLPRGSSPVGGFLSLIDLARWTVRETNVHIDLWPNRLVFSPDGSRLAIGASSDGDHTLVVIDVAKGRLVAQRALEFDPLEIVFTPDGDSLMVYGARYPGSDGLNPVPTAAIVRVTDLRVTWRLDLADVKHGQYAPEGLSSQQNHDSSIWWRPAVIFAPERQRMYIVHADSDLLTTVDFGLRSRRTVSVHGQTAWIERLLALGATPAYAKELNGTSKAGVLSPDGQRLFIVGRSIRSAQDSNGAWDIEETELGLRVIEIATGELIDTFDSAATQIAWGPRAQLLLLGGWDQAGHVWTDVLDPGDFEVLAHRTKLDLLIAVPVKGAALFASSFTHAGPASQVQLLDTATWNAVRQWSMPGYVDIWYAGPLPSP